MGMGPSTLSLADDTVAERMHFLHPACGGTSPTGWPEEDDLLSAALYHCIAAGDWPLVERLVARGGSVDFVNAAGQNPLTTAIHSGKLETARKLILYFNADLSVQDVEYEGYTALHHAIEYYADHRTAASWAIVELLLHCGAKARAVDNFGVTCSDLAEREGLPAVKTLLEATIGFTALHYATEARNGQAIQTLLLNDARSTHGPKRHNVLKLGDIRSMSNPDVLSAFGDFEDQTHLEDAYKNGQGELREREMVWTEVAQRCRAISTPQTPIGLLEINVRLAHAFDYGDDKLVLREDGAMSDIGHDPHLGGKDLSQVQYNEDPRNERAVDIFGRPDFVRWMIWAEQQAVRQELYVMLEDASKLWSPNSQSHRLWPASFKEGVLTVLLVSLRQYSKDKTCLPQDVSCYVLSFCDRDWFIVG